jgi:8-oxo-dGTP diphosphatase
LSFVHVAVGVIYNTSGEILIALRDTSRHQGGLWEFPGGKVEQGEDVQQALARELLEEVNIEVLQCSVLLTNTHDYGDKQVLLDVWRVDGFSGIAEGREGQAIRWVSVDELQDYEFPEANIPIIQSL